MFWLASLCRYSLLPSNDPIRADRADRCLSLVILDLSTPSPKLRLHRPCSQRWHVPSRMGMVRFHHLNLCSFVELLRIPSIVWQCLWNFFFGPYLLLKVHKIHDAYHWRLQTMLSILAGYVCLWCRSSQLLILQRLPGTPLWIAGVYSDAFAPVNRYWVPAMWYVVPIHVLMYSI